MKKINKLLKKQFGCELDLEFEEVSRKLWVGNKKVFQYEIPFVQRKGIYFGYLEHDGVRLSIEGAQLIGPRAKKNILEIDKEELTEWLRGYALTKKAPKGYLLMKYKEHFVGCGKSNGKKIWNNIPKERRIRNITELP